jgi:transcriptional regulator with XRE-family HTH domain
MLHNVEVEKNRSPNNLKAWREFRKLSQAELAEKVGTTGSMISMLETEQRGLSAKWLRRLAPALGTTPGHLLDLDPEEMDADLFDIWTAIADRDKPRAKRVLEAFRTGTTDR